ncbi:MAG: hypothetical protein RIQ56_199, partial [Candidatus Parcubacteria bacterium]
MFFERGWLGSNLSVAGLLFLGVFLSADIARAEIRLAHQLIATSSVDQSYLGGQNNYPAQTFTAESSGTILSVALADHGCGVQVSDGAFSYSGFGSPVAIPGGWRYTGGSFPVATSGVYYLTSGCNNNPGNFGGATQDVYSGGEAGHMRLPGVFSTQFVSNASTGNALRDWAFAVCTTTDCSLELPPPCSESCYSNVMFLPGIEASRLYGIENGVEEKFWEPGSDLDAQQLMMTPTGESQRGDIYTKDVLDNAYLPIKGNVYKSFVTDMDELKSNGTIKDWSAAAYDWRLLPDAIVSGGTQTGDMISYLIATSSPYLEQELRRLAVTSKSGKVTLVAHSNGGLIAKALLLRIGAAQTQALVDKVILVASPQVGTPQALAGLLHGHDQGLPTRVLPVALSQNVARTVGDTMPGLYALLPSEAYFSVVQDHVAMFSTSTLIDWAAKYGQEVHSQTAQHEFLADSELRSQPLESDLLNPTILNDTFLTHAETLHDELDGWTPPAGVKVIQIAGWGVPTTLTGIDYSRSFHDGSLTVTPFPRFTIDGDGTVVTPSALWLPASEQVERYWVDLKAFNTEHKVSTVFGFIPFSHASILEVNPVRSFVTDLVASSTKPISSYGYLMTVAPTSVDVR